MVGDLDRPGEDLALGEPVGASLQLCDAVVVDQGQRGGHGLRSDLVQHRLGVVGHRVADLQRLGVVLVLPFVFGLECLDHRAYGVGVVRGVVAADQVAGEVDLEVQLVAFDEDRLAAVLHLGDFEESLPDGPGVDLAGADGEQPMRLDHLETLVHQRG